MTTVTAALFGCHRPHSVADRVSNLRASVSANLPVGCPYPDVIAYLDKNKIQHTDYKKADGEEERRVLGADARIDGILRNVDHNWFARSDIILEFRFDSQGRLQSSKVYESVTAP